MQNSIQINFADFVQIQETQPITTSEFIAEAFGKRHDDVLRRIDELLMQVPDFFNKRNFAEIERTVKVGFGERKFKCYQLTKDGFMLVVMGFTGKQAMQIKIAYIDAFNAMAEKLKQLAVPIDTRITPSQKQAIREAVKGRVYRTGETYKSVYEKLHALLRVNSYHEIQSADFQTALSFLESIPNTPARAEPAEAVEEYVNGRLVKYIANLRISQFDDSIETYLLTFHRGKMTDMQAFRPSNACLAA